MASCSSSLKRDVQEFGWGLAVFEAFGNHAKGEGLHAGDGLITIGAVAHDPSQRRDFRQPPAVILAFELDGKGHARTVASGQQSNNRLEPSRRTLRAIPSEWRAAQAAALGVWSRHLEVVADLPGQVVVDVGMARHR